MSVLLAIVGLALGGAFAMAFTIAGRWAAGLPLGERSLRAAYGSYPAGTRTTPPNARVSFARALGGIVGWYLAAGLLVGCSFLASGEPRVDDQSMRVQVGHGGPAETAGIKNGDRVLAVDGVAIHDWDALKRGVASRGGEPVNVEVERDGEKLTIEVKPVGPPPKIMVGPPTTNEPVGVGRAAAIGALAPGKQLVSTARAFGRMVMGTEHAEVSGPVGVVRETANAQRSGLGVAAKLVSLLVSYLLVYVIPISLGIALASLRRKSATIQG